MKEEVSEQTKNNSDTRRPSDNGADTAGVALPSPKCLDVRKWHQADLPGRLLFGRFQEQSGYLPATAEHALDHAQPL